MEQNDPEINSTPQPPRRRRAAPPAYEPGENPSGENVRRPASSDQRYTQQPHGYRTSQAEPRAARSEYRQQPRQNAAQRPVPPVPPGEAATPPVQPMTPPNQNLVVNVMNTNNAAAGGTDSHFDGRLSQQIGYLILGTLVTVFTLGICYPWAFCMQYRWRIKHTVINGHRLSFDGKAVQLLGKWLLWMLLCVVTLGIYSFWVGIALERWRVKHTHFAS